MIKSTSNAAAKHQKRIQSIKMLLLTLLLIIAVTILFLRVYNAYNDKVLYSERLNQMKEVTSQLFSGLEDVTRTRWKNAETQLNSLVDASPESLDDLLSFMKKQVRLDALESENISIITIDTDGVYYTESGQKGLLSEQRYLLSEPERVSFVTNSLFGNDTRMVFLIKLPKPAVIKEGNKSIKITYCGITQDMAELQPYFNCTAYGGQNGMYVTDEQGLKIFSGNNDNILKGYNIYSALKKMDYLHDSSFKETKAEFEKNGIAYSNAVYRGVEYYYALYHMDNAEWNMVLTIPSSYVATNTVDLVNTTVKIILIFAVILICTSATLIFILMRRQQEIAVENERQNSEKLEVLNEKLKSAVTKAEAAEQIAKNANKAKSDFLSNMSHDIRTPMNAIVGITNLMEHEENDPEKLDAYIHKVQNSSRHLLSLINDVLDMSKIESSDVTLNVEPMNLAEQISQIDNIIRPQTEEKHQTFVIRVHEITHEFLLGDGVRIRQVFINLLSNAVKYTQDNGMISLDLTELPCDNPRRTKFSIIVTDNGCGMTQEFMDHIFEPFVRAENSTTNRVQGTGLGMAITKKIIELMNGTITVQSEPGKGSRFEAILPLEISTEVECTLPIKEILLLCDEDEMIENVRASLKKNDILLQAVKTKENAKTILQNGKIDVILLGNCIKDPTLAETVKMLRETSNENILIFCCDYSDPEKVYSLLKNCGADGFIQRPFFLSNFIRILDATNENKNQDKETELNILKGKKFLCAEDNELNAEILEAILEMEGAECTIYPNGKELVDAFLDIKLGEYDAILMDVQMPVMNGLEATKAIRVSDNPLGRRIPIIAMTANAFSSDVQACLDAGMNAHVSKPLDIAVLARTIKSLQTDIFFGGGKTVHLH